MGSDLVPFGDRLRKRHELKPLVLVPEVVNPVDDGTQALREGYQLGLEIGRKQRRFHHLRYLHRSEAAKRTGTYPHWFLVLLLFVLPMISAAASLSPLSAGVHLVAILAPLLLVLPVVALIASRSAL